MRGTHALAMGTASCNSCSQGAAAQGLAHEREHPVLMPLSRLLSTGREEDRRQAQAHHAPAAHAAHGLHVALPQPALSLAGQQPLLEEVFVVRVGAGAWVALLFWRLWDGVWGVGVGWGGVGVGMSKWSGFLAKWCPSAACKAASAKPGACCRRRSRGAQRVCRCCCHCPVGGVPEHRASCWQPSRAVHAGRLFKEQGGRQVGSGGQRGRLRSAPSVMALLCSLCALPVAGSKYWPSRPPAELA